MVPSLLDVGPAEGGYSTVASLDLADRPCLTKRVEVMGDCRLADRPREGTAGVRLAVGPGRHTPPKRTTPGRSGRGGEDYRAGWFAPWGEPMG